MLNSPDSRVPFNEAYIVKRFDSHTDDALYDLVALHLRANV